MSSVPYNNGNGGGNVDLLKKHGTKAWANISRENILHNIATAACLTERVFWALILTSWCGPHVREACFLRNEDGHLVLDEHDEPIPLRPKHLLALLKLDPSNRGKITQSIAKLVHQKRLQKKLGLWYPVFDPYAVEGVREKDTVTGSDLPYTFPTHILGLKLPPDLFTGDDVAVTETLRHLQQIKDEAVKGLRLYMQQQRTVLSQYISERRIIISEKLEESEELEHTHPAASEPDSAPEPVGNGVCVSHPESIKAERTQPFDRQGTWDTFWVMYSTHEHGNPNRRQAAWLWWWENVKSAEYVDEITSGLSCHLLTDRWKRGIGIPDAINYLTQHRYREHPKPAKKAPDIAEDNTLQLLEEIHARKRKRGPLQNA